jgi:hypothetical protein
MINGHGFSQTMKTQSHAET